MRKAEQLSSDYVFLILSGIFLLLGIVFFTITPEEVPVAEYKVPVLAFFASLTVAAVGNIVIGIIQKGVSLEAARALQKPLNDLEKSVSQIRQIHHLSDVGVVGVFPNRTSAMVRFRGEIEREDKLIDFVGTSLRGIIDPAGENEDKRSLHELFHQKRNNGVKIRALLMHPAYGEFRERVENRERAAVAKDIQGTLKYLLDFPFTQIDEKEVVNNSSPLNKNKLLETSDLRLYPGVITAFAIFTSRSMLVNISTLHGPVYDNVTMIVEDTPDPNSLFKRFRANHFETPWSSEKSIRLSGINNNNILKKLIELDFTRTNCRFKEGEWPPTIPDTPMGN